MTNLLYALLMIVLVSDGGTTFKVMNDSRGPYTTVVECLARLTEMKKYFEGQGAKVILSGCKNRDDWEKFWGFDMFKDRVIGIKHVIW